MLDKKTKHKPKLGTESYRQYCIESQSSLGLFTFILDSVMSSDYVSAVAKQALEGPENLKIESPGELASISPGPRTKHIRKNKQLFLELFLSRLVDNFQCYIVSVIREVLNVQPRVLVSSQPTLSLEYVFQFQNIEDLQADVVEAKVNDLSYQGFQKLKQWCLERSIPIIVDSVFEAKLVELISIRNIIVHNRGIIDKKYLRTHRDSKFEFGKLREIDVDELFESDNILHKVVSDTDIAIQGKFNLPTVTISPDSKTPEGSAHDTRQK